MHFGTFILGCTLFSSIVAFTLPQYDKDNPISIFMNDAPCKNKLKCENGATCEVSGETFVCKCKIGTSGVYCGTIDDCKNISFICGDEEKSGAKCVYDSEKEKNVCKCNEKSLHFDRNSVLCRDCHSGQCLKKECNCCPGYGIFQGGMWFQHDSCEKCDCGENYNCTFTGNYITGRQWKKCICPSGYVDDEGVCKQVCSGNTDCYNGGRCEKKGQWKFCVCKHGTTGDMCDVVKDCETGGKYEKCKDGKGKCLYDEKEVNAVCTCSEKQELYEARGYCAVKCKNDTDCEGNRNCNSDNFCVCKDGYEGDDCEVIIGCKTLKTQCDKIHKECIFDEKAPGMATCKCEDAFNYDPKANECRHKCSRRVCRNGGKCIVKEGKAVCNCTDKYTGEFCEKDKCSEITCLNNGTCIIKERKAACNCTDKYTGKFCQTDKTSVDKSGDRLFISLYLHRNRSLPRNTKLDFHFEMKEDSNSTLTQIHLRLNLDSSGQQKENNCSSLRCQNNGTCEVEKGEAVCRCTDKYTGKLCEIDKCSQIKCRNGGVCDVKSGKAICLCNGTYTGDFCEIDKCSVIKCKNGGMCDIRNGSAVCICHAKFTGDLCEIDKCSVIKCQNGGMCDIRNGSSVCICHDKFSGDLCQIDKCSVIKCQNGGMCDIRNGSAVCICHDKFTGDLCEIDKCSMKQCHNGGKCDIKKGKATCTCNDNYIGEFCEIDKCSLMRCLNGGKCEIRNQKTVCVCTENFTGDFCEQRNSFLKGAVLQKE